MSTRDFYTVSTRLTHRLLLCTLLVFLIKNFSDGWIICSAHSFEDHSSGIWKSPCYVFTTYDSIGKLNLAEEVNRLTAAKTLTREYIFNILEGRCILYIQSSNTLERVRTLIHSLSIYYMLGIIVRCWVSSIKRLFIHLGFYKAFCCPWICMGYNSLKRITITWI